MKKSLSLAIAASLVFSSLASAVTVTNVHSVKGGTVRTTASSIGNYSQQHDGVRYIDLNSGLGDTITSYGGTETGEILSQHKSSGTFTGESRYKIIGEAVVGNSTETQQTTGFDKVTTNATYDTFSNGTENTYSLDGVINDTRYFNNTEFGSFSRFTRTDFQETVTSRSHFAE